MRSTGLDAFLCLKTETVRASLKTRQWTNSDREEDVTELFCRRQSPRELSSCFVLRTLINSVVSCLGDCHRSVFRKSVDGGTGSQKNGTWDGMIGMLVHGQAEVGVSSFLITAKRMEVVDFTLSLAEAR